MFRVRVRVASLIHPDDVRELEAVVDTGSSYTVIPRTIAAELGVLPVRKMTARLANGVRIVREMGEALLAIGDLRTHTWVVFGESDDAVLLGAVTLQELGLEVNPTTETLKPAEAYMFRAASGLVRALV